MTLALTGSAQMKASGETAVRLARRYGLPIHEEADAHEGPRQDIPLEDALWIVDHADPQSIRVEAEPELIATVITEPAPRQI
ncbi:MAG TPA: hypothetical protein VNQ79_04345 [Blastocatellia bacterium]|nr:hypothetical protein [Blastocatellia bacterium]